MGKISQGILGGFSGKVGNVIGGNWKGIDYMRSKASQKRDANSEKQQNQRAKFIGCTSLANSVLDTIIQPIWNRKAVKMTGYNLFVKTNLPVFDTNGAITNYANLKFSVGELPLPTNLIIQNNGAGNGALLITWSDNSGTGIAAPTDRIRVLVICEGEVVVKQGMNFPRQSEFASFSIPFGTGKIVHVYAFFENEDKTKYSISNYTLLTID